MIEFVLLDDITRLGVAVERDDAQLRSPALEFAYPICDCRVGDYDQCWEALERGDDVPYERDNLDRLTLDTTCRSASAYMNIKGCSPTRPISSARIQFCDLFQLWHNQFTPSTWNGMSLS